METDRSILLTHLDVQRWLPVAELVEPSLRLEAEIQHLVEAAPRLAEAARALWEPTLLQPGLRDAGPFLPENLPEQLRSLGRALAHLHTAIEHEVQHGARQRELWAHGRFLLGELTALLAWVGEAMEMGDLPWRPSLDDGDLVHPRALAGALAALTRTVRAYEETVAQVPGFQQSLILAAEAVTEQLWQLEATEVLRPAADRDLVLLRRQIALLLQARIRLLRGAATYVFRSHPALLGQLLPDTRFLAPAGPPAEHRTLLRTPVGRPAEWGRPW